MNPLLLLTACVLNLQASHPLHSWRFINKYTNRSNGGIPMFSEERQRERQEKVFLLRFNGCMLVALMTDNFLHAGKIEITKSDYTK